MTSARWIDKGEIIVENVVIFGLGYVGLPLSLSFALRGSSVVGVDVSRSLVDEINMGITYHTEKYNNFTIREILGEQLKNKQFRAVTDVKDVPEGYNNYIITVGIPVQNGLQDMSQLMGCCKSLGKALKKGDLVVVRSTVIPGSTEELVLPILEEESHLKAGKDFYIAYSSERIAEGNAFEEFANMPTVVGAIDNASLEKACSLLSIVCKAEIVRASSIKVVETSKVIENVQRDVNIAMVQEFARFAESLGIDIYDVIRVANTHKRVNLLYPGPGVGGYCIPNAYYYLEPKARELGVGLDILKLSRQKNEALPETIVGMIEKRLSESGRKLQGMKIAVLGIAMKDYSNDDRISPPVSIINLLISKGAEVFAYDSAVPTQYDFKHDNLIDVLNGADVLMILAKQHSFDNLAPDIIINSLKKDAFIFDARNMLSSKKDEFVKNGIGYFSL